LGARKSILPQHKNEVLVQSQSEFVFLNAEVVEGCYRTVQKILGAFFLVINNYKD